ncbi:ExeA family protein [Uliginosibacterium sp. H1]|uniref:ExeA family protein n=1 Tax=Uliginosibacterium sp. H1 TaxID=3114757 RepID=UPI002E17287D|nr:AAA family ATPase [Uliginosibacterium sp. H1]
MTIYLEHFGLREPPFRITPQLEYFFSGAQRGAMLHALQFAVTHDEGIVMVSGEVGTGKTMLARMLLERLDAEARVIYLSNPSLSPEDLLATLALELGVGKVEALTALRSIEARLVELHAEGRRVVLMVDEAHAMPAATLEQVRLLSNLESPTRKLLQIVLFGQPELDTLLASREMRSLRERITQRFALRPLGQREASEYLRFRLHAAGYRGPDPFSRGALRSISGAAAGLTRRLNILADKALTAAYADGTHHIGRKQARLAIRDAGYPPTVFGSGRRHGWTIAALCAAGLAAAGIWLVNRPSAPEAAAAAPAPSAAPVAASLPATATAADASGPTALKPASSAPASPPRSLDERIATARPLIAERPVDHWFIQLLTANPQDTAAVDSFISRAGQEIDPEALLVYSSAASGRPRLGVIYGNYADQASAARALAAMPAWLRGSGAYVRSYKVFR